MQRHVADTMQRHVADTMQRHVADTMQRHVIHVIHYTTCYFSGSHSLCQSLVAPWCRRGCGGH